MDDSDADVARLAARQHGLVTLRQLRGVGVAPGAVRQRVESGRWRRVDSGVYRIAGVPVTWRSEVLARVLSAGQGAVASHRTAAALWELDGCRPGAPELTIPQGRRYRRAGVRTHVSADLHLVTPAVRDGIPTTPVGRTLLDLGAVVDRSRVHLALDDAQRRKLIDWDGVLDTLAAHARRGRDGVATLRSIVDEHDADVAVTDSGFERLVAILLVAAGLPRPVVQHRIVIGGRTIRIDLAYPAARIAIELDGGIHLRRDVWETDRPRQNAVVLEGWTVLRFTWHTYRHHPDRLVSDVRRALRRSGLAA